MIFKQRSHLPTADKPLKSACPPLEGNNRSKLMKTKKGFTLVELLVVMGMSAIMIAVTLVSMGDARSRKAVEGEARKMAATIREVQNYALTGKKFDATQPTCSIGIDDIVAGASQYETYYRHRNALGSSCADSTNVPVSQSFQTYIFQNGVKTRSIAEGGADVNNFGFSVPRGNLVDAYGAALASVQIQLKKGTAIWSVCIYSGGRVEEKAGSSC